ncbi:hypothetical protein [Candidatus Arthromitus sp. SFB-turkey]|uniref:hypothetical protein n=1 Tax=Candidatus Arthromitus sp. SFB-turkey TaxID=1840217 RepID=UPI0012E857B0|nr:hypothetical protein [Candidatus Arthromitus sp. SFB-turkey]HJC99717.1 hypothetical protein [Candidatus Dwaynia gallinarum]
MGNFKCVFVFDEWVEVSDVLLIVEAFVLLDSIISIDAPRAAMPVRPKTIILFKLLL